MSTTRISSLLLLLVLLLWMNKKRHERQKKKICRCSKMPYKPCLPWRKTTTVMMMMTIKRRRTTTIISIMTQQQRRQRQSIHRQRAARKQRRHARQQQQQPQQQYTVAKANDGPCHLPKRLPRLVPRGMIHCWVLRQQQQLQQRRRQQIKKQPHPLLPDDGPVPLHPPHHPHRPPQYGIDVILYRVKMYIHVGIPIHCYNRHPFLMVVQIHQVVQLPPIGLPCRNCGIPYRIHTV